jgi:D-alanine-D-alanine ligase
LTEQLGGDRRGDKNIASLLDMLGIKYTGSGPQGLMLSRDKRLCKDILSLHKIRVPGFISIPVKKKQQIPKHIQYPLVVKPAFEDSSEGIANASLVNAENALRERAAFIHDRWNQAAIAEEFIEGRELYVGVLGNKKLMVLPVRECHFQGPQGEGPIMATYRVKWDYEYRQKWNIKFGFAELDDDVLKNIQRICKKVYRILQIRDYGRIDLRLRPDGKIVVLEANPNPDIAYGEEVAEAAEKAGISYEELMGKIIQLALKRYA